MCKLSGGINGINWKFVDMIDLENIKRQLEVGKTQIRTSFSCCGQAFPSLYLFRQHLFECHREAYGSLSEELFHREISKAVVKGSKRRINQRGRVKKKGRSDHSYSIYKTNTRPISIPMGGLTGK